MPDKNGAVVSNRDAEGSGQSPINVNFNVQNMASQAGFEVSGVEQSGTEVTINAIVTDLRSGNGPVSRALFETTSTTSRATG